MLGDNERPPESEEQRNAGREEQRLNWNLDRFRNDLGFEEITAQLLAETGVDWHEADNLIRRGCPLDTAVGILA